MKTILDRLEARDKGYYYICRCPECNRIEAYVYKDDIEKYQKDHSKKIPVRCNRKNHCGKTTWLMLDEDIKIPEKKSETPRKVSRKGIGMLQYLVEHRKEIYRMPKNWRGISQETMMENRILLYPEGFQSICTNHPDDFATSFQKGKLYKNRDIIVPIEDENGRLCRLLLRGTEAKENENYRKEVSVLIERNSLEIWNIKDLLDMDLPYVFVTEGIPDGLSIKECDKEAGVISLPGVHKYKHVIRFIKKHPEIKRKQIIIAFDNDLAGNEASRELRDSLDAMHMKSTEMNMGGYKDINEYLLADREALTEEIKKSTGKNRRWKRH